MRRLRRTLRRLRRRGWRERFALVEAGALLACVRLALLLLPFRTVLALADRVGRLPRPERAESPGPERDERLDRLVRATSAVAGRTFRNPCLSQALVVRALYRRRGRTADLRIGVRRSREGSDPPLEAHAWVESGGKVVIGGADAPREYATLPTMPSLRRPGRPLGRA